jgi:hypothetical protein
MTTPDTPRRTSARRDKDSTPSKPKTPVADKAKPLKASNLDNGPAQGLYDNKVVQSKIMKWQAQSHGEIPTADPNTDLSSEDAPSPEPPAGQRPRGRTAPSTPLKETEDIKVILRPKSAGKAPDNTIEEDTRAATAPKKRVISDGHWRKNRSPPKDNKKPQEKKTVVVKQAGWVRPAQRRQSMSKPATPQSPAVVIPARSPAQTPTRTAEDRLNSIRRRRKSEAEKAGDLWRKRIDDDDDSLHAQRNEGSPRDSPRQSPTPPKRSYTIERRRARSADRSPRESQSTEETPHRKRRTSHRVDHDDAENQELRDKVEVIVDETSPESARRQRRSARNRTERGAEVDVLQESPYDKIERWMSASQTPKDDSPQSAGDILSSEPHQNAGERAKSSKISREHSSEPDVAVIDSAPETPQEESGRRRRLSKRSQAPHEHLSPVTQEHQPSAERKSSHRKLQKRNPSFSYDAEDVAAETQQQPPQIFPSRIQAWLTDTPDPFVDTHSQANTLPSRSGTVRRRSKEHDAQSRSEKDSSLDPRESEPSLRPNSSRRHKRRSLEDGKEVQAQPSNITIPPVLTPDGHTHSSPGEESPTNSLISLKRRGARRRSPTKSSPHTPGYTPITEAVPEESVVSSEASASSVDPSTFIPPEISARSGPISLALRRPFPSTGKRLSTIASVDTFKLQSPPSMSGSEATEKPEAAAPEVASTLTSVIESVNEAHPSDDTKSQVTLKGRSSSKRSKIASHADLMSVLSLPASRSKSIVSARSIRTYRSRLATATVDDLMFELSSDEVKYKRELRTLVDGVIPVLLSCVLSKTDSAIAAGLFSKNAAKNDPTVTRPILDMGVALERLKMVHKRIPLDNPDTFLSWSQSAQKVYADYIKFWRMGFQDVVVNLAPENEGTKSVADKPKEGVWDEALPRNEEGYVINGDGERVDVAFLLKRPLVRLKYLAKTLKV